MNQLSNSLATHTRRRLYRRNRPTVDPRLYCGTNGCASILEFDPRSGIGTCRICGFTRRVARPLA